MSLCFQFIPWTLWDQASSILVYEFLVFVIQTFLIAADVSCSGTYKERINASEPGLTWHANHKMFPYMEISCHTKKTFYVLAMTLMFSIYDHCMDCMISYNCMALLWKPCFQVWPFYGNHVSKYDPFMETMFSTWSMALLWKPCFQVWPFYGNHVFWSMAILWMPCFLSMALLWKSCFLKYGTLMKPALLLISSQNTSHIRTHHFFWKWHLSLEAQHDLNPCFQSMVISWNACF